MNFYCGIDLSARDSHLCVIDEKLKALVDVKVKNDLARIVKLLEPYKPTMKIVVESTFNWYWLVDGLRAEGFQVCLAHTLGLSMITGAKVKTDRRDAFSLAKLLLAGVIPEAYIYPPETRPVRDLLRQRSRLVRKRAEEYGGLRRLLLREGIMQSSRNEIKLTDEADLERWFTEPLLQVSARQELERIRLYAEQIKRLEELLLERTKGDSSFQRLQGVCGIGQTLALTILYEVGEITRFASVRQFCSYCRVVPGVAQSGAVTRRGRASKQGNHYLKWAFSQAAVHAVRCYPKARRAFERQLARHRGSGRKMIAYNIIAHRIAQSVFYVLRDGVEFREELLFGS